MHRSLPCEKSAEIYSKVTCCPWNDTNGHNYDEPGTEVFRNNRFVSRVGLNLISQHIKLRGKTNKYAFFGLLQLILENWGHFQAKFHLQYKIYSTVDIKRSQFHTSHITRCSLTILGLKR